MLGSSTEIWAVCPLTWRAIDLGSDQISSVCKALATIAISLHHECYRTLAPLSPLAGSNTQLCVAIEQLPRYSTGTGQRKRSSPSLTTSKNPCDPAGYVLPEGGYCQIH